MVQNYNTTEPVALHNFAKMLHFAWSHLVTNLSASAINPSKGIHLVPRVMPKAYPWLSAALLGSTPKRVA